jgi:formate-dependent nitrite reductase cytochrome c552 subunit
LEKNRKDNAECLACHSAAGLKNPPRADLDLAKLKETLLEADAFGGSNHGHMACKQCHGQGYNDYPHAANARYEVSPCSECHATKVARLEPQYEASVHSRSASTKEKFTCITCHNPHLSLVATKLKNPRKIVFQDNKDCLDCHNSEARFARFAPDDEKTPGIKKKRPDIDTLHDWLPNARLHWRAVRCVECHTPAVPANRMLSHEILDKEKAEKNCLSCHATDSSLRTRLYRHLVKEEVEQYGFVNSAILSSSYVIGATKNPLLDAIVIGMVLLTLLGVLVHGAIRVILALLRKGKAK